MIVIPSVSRCLVVDETFASIPIIVSIVSLQNNSASALTQAHPTPTNTIAMCLLIR